MNSALKPVLPQPGVPQPGGQASPAKGNVASANHAVGLPQGANSVHPPGNSLSVQNLSQHALHAPLAPAAPPPSMAPVSANMAQMAQNMSHHGNLSLLPAAPAQPSPKGVGPSALSLVQPLALTRAPDKKDEPGPANGTVDCPKPAAAAPLKPQHPEPKQDKPDIPKTSPSVPKPPEKPASTPPTPQKPEASVPVSQTDGPAQPKVATANEPPEKSPSKPTELKPAPAADVAPSQSDSKPVPESANDNQSQEKPSSPPKEAEASAKPEPSVAKEKVDEVVEKPKNPAVVEPQAQKTDKTEPEKPKDGDLPKKEEPEKPVPAKDVPVVEKKPETKVLSKAEVKVTPKSTLKLATVTPPMRKRRQVSEKLDGATPSKKSAEDAGTPDIRTKRNRTKVQLYQSPTPELAMATKLSASAGRATPTKPNDDKLIVFYKNEYLAVRNAEGGFYVCQAVQNVYRSTRKIKIRWLSQDKADSKGETYKPDFYDVTDMECVLTTLSLQRASGGAQILKAGERARAQSILQRALRAEQSGANCLQLTEEHPDGLDLSLYKDESQLEKKATRKRNSSKSSPKAEVNDTAKSEPTPSKKVRSAPLRGARTPAAAPPPPRGAAGPSSKVGIVRRIYRHTATALTEKAKAKTPAKRTPVKPAKVETPVATPRKGRRAAKENKSTPVVPTPSTSTGKTSRTRRPVKK
ncbi:nucleolar protein dao-5-like isoform X1 [Maniola hyperantus]|uniref:nucleolar protein dao-5-like isoform X1 n=1 Tax=Aphantopus hyperantus TaxID=2795564 RepID=UPI001569DF53|nr:proteoglycan 4-like [Maniola hyperantus]